MTISRLTQPTSQIQRIEYCGMHVDLIGTSEGLVRVGGMPDIAKFMAEHGFRAEIVIVPPWEATMAGDNYTGEEFVLWQAQVKGGITKRYVGTPDDLELLYRNLNETFAYYFDDKRLFIVKKSWINNWFSRQPAAPLFESGTLQIRIENGNIILTDRGQTLYDRSACTPSQDPDLLVEKALGKVPRDSKLKEALEVQAIGTGNGFMETVSNFIVRFGDKAIWIDPCGYPAHTLLRHGVHWDDVTHLIVTHNHEDHIQGFSACLKRAEKTGQPIELLTAPSIHAVLEKQFSPWFPNFSSLVRLTPLQPGSPVKVGEIEVNCRLNHHFLPFGTLGLKFSARGKTFGYSGDTKFDPAINAVIGRKELEPEWFAECDLLFHEVDFDNPNGVHTHWKQLQKLADAIPARVLAYHTPHLAHAPLPLAEQGKVYRLT
jgi:L-ascorbate metabolism protein UlaG (beta-lactamase superfamily)